MIQCLSKVCTTYETDQSIKMEMDKEPPQERQEICQNAQTSASSQEEDQHSQM